MILRAITLAGGLAGAAGLSQYPEFSQQYTQNLAGQVEALQVVVADFDASAARSGMTRAQALSEMTGAPFLDDRRTDMTRTFSRFDTISGHLAALQSATAMQRLTMPHRMADPETFANAWAHFKPALPLTSAGAVSGAAGFAGGWAGVLVLLSLVRWPFRRRRSKTPSRLHEPPVTRRAPRVPTPTRDGIRD